MNHIMIDLETMSSRNDAALVQIGAYRFDPKGNDTQIINDPIVWRARSFFMNVNLNDCIRLGLHIDGDTVEWWMGQSELARASLYSPAPVDLSVALAAFEAWLPENATHIWSHATFDVPIIQHAWQVARHTRPPWSYRAARDIRTLEDLAGGHDTIEYPDRKGLQHQANMDAWAQACAVQQAWQRVRNSLTTSAG